MVTALIKKVRSSAEFSNISWLITDRIWRMLLSLLVGVWVVRYLGPENYGLINYVMAFAGIGLAVSNLGMESFLIRELTVWEDNKERIVYTGFILRLITSVTVSLIVLSYLFITGEPAIVFLLFLISMLQLLSSSFGIVDLAFQAILKSRIVVIYRNIFFIISSLLKLLAIITHQGIFVFAFLTIADIVAGDIALFFAYRRRHAAFVRSSIDAVLVKRLLRTAVPFLLSNLAIVVYMKIDQILLGKLALKEEVGFFSAATKISEIFYFIPLVITGSLYKILIEARKESEARFRRISQRIFLSFLGGSVAISVMVYVFSPLIITLLFGEPYLPSVPVLQIYIWALVFIFVGVAFNQLLVIEEESSVILYKTLVGVVLNILLNIILIPQYGAVGAAVATVITQFISVIGANFFFGKARRLFMIYLSNNKN